ncbi:MAG: thiazole synthase, partial [Limnobacter sp.]
MNTQIEKNNDTWKVGNREFTSRLLVGTGKYSSLDETRDAITESGAEIVTVAIRRTNIGQNAGEASLLDYIPPSQFTYLPNSAGCYTAKD